MYPTRDGFIYLALGSDAQWKRLTQTPMFAPLATPRRTTNAGRHDDRVQLRLDVTTITQRHTTAEVGETLAASTVPWAAINDVRQVRELPALAKRLTTTRTPAGSAVKMQPAAVTRPGMATEYAFPPKYGAHTRSVLAEAGFGSEEITALAQAGVVAEA